MSKLQSTYGMFTLLGLKKILIEKYDTCDTSKPARFLYNAKFH